MMDKRGDINENTPPEHKCCGGSCQDSKLQPLPRLKLADEKEDHLTKRLADAAGETPPTTNE